MLNRKPIFINGFSSGGTTILTNFLASHPDVCTVSEIHHLFKGHSLTDTAFRVLMKCVFHDAPAMVLSGQDFFSPRSISPRKKLSGLAKRFVDRVLYKEKLRSQNVFFNRFKHQDVEYSRQEIVNSRLVGKNVDGMIFTSDALTEMYPDATFIGLLRDGLAVCESHLRKNRSAREIGFRYRVLGQKMQADARRFSHYQLIRFEDLLSDPVMSVRRLYDHAGLEFDKLRDVRMQIRRVLDKDGNHRLRGGSEWDVVWSDLNGLASHFQKDVNRHQIQRLSAADRDAFLEEAGETMELLGYPTSSSTSEQAA